MFEDIAFELSIPISRMDEKIYLFEDVVEEASINSTWLRTFIQRDVSDFIVSKHRSGRLFFSLRNIVRIILLHDLNFHLKVAPAHSWEIVDHPGWCYEDGYFKAPVSVGPEVSFRYLRLIEPLRRLSDRLI